MKRFLRPLTILLPLAGLAVMWFMPRDAVAPPAAQAGPAAAASLAEDAKTAIHHPPPVAVKTTPPAAAGILTYSGESAGSDGGLRPALAAESRGRNELPSGRRFRFESFPNLRTLREGQHVTVGLPDGRSFPGRLNWSRPDEGYENTHQVSVGFTGDKGGLVAIHDGTTDRVQGRLLVEGDHLGWTLEPENNGKLWL